MIYLVLKYKGIRESAVYFQETELVNLRVKEIVRFQNYSDEII